jgi:hypothetical protein
MGEFAGPGPDVEERDIRAIPLGTMIGHDATLECVVNLEVGSGLWRHGIGCEWNPSGGSKS